MIFQKQKYVRISKEGTLNEISPKIYVSPEVYVWKKINNNYVNYVRFPIYGGTIIKKDDGYLIEEGGSIVLLLMGYHVYIRDINIIQCNGYVGFVVVHEPEEGVRMSDPWNGGLLLEFPSGKKAKIEIKYEIDNGIYEGTMIMDSGIMIMGYGRIRYHRVRDFRGVPIRIRELEQILEQD